MMLRKMEVNRGGLQGMKGDEEEDEKVLKERSNL